jgi:peptidoglycan hydrolase FlgJ
MINASPVDLGLSLSSMNAATATKLAAEARTKSKARVVAQDFEAMYLDTVFQEMSTGIKGDGPFGGSGALKVWRSLLTDQYAKSFAKAGGIGIANDIYHELLQQQGIKS